jgi:hypothetical protein
LQSKRSAVNEWFNRTLDSRLDSKGDDVIILIAALTSRRLGRIRDVKGALDATQSAGGCGNGMSEDSYRGRRGSSPQGRGARWRDGWEIRTTVSLARLLRDTARRDEAHTSLAPI